MKLLVGLLKGAVIGGAIGYGAFALGKATGFDNPWLTFGLVGMLVGLFVGRPIWSLIKDSSSTSWVSVLKAAFGFGVGCGLYALISKVWSPTIEIAGYPFMQSVILSGAVGAVYGGFVELDDAIGGDGDKDKGKAPAKKALPAKATKKVPPALRSDDD